MSSFLWSSPEGPRRPTYQRLRTCFKCCWQHRALRLREGFRRFGGFKLSRAQQELNLARGGSHPTKGKTLRNVHAHSHPQHHSLLPTCCVFLQLRFGGSKASIRTHCWLGDHSQVFSSVDLLHSCFLVHLWVKHTMIMSNFTNNSVSIKHCQNIDSMKKVLFHKWISWNTWKTDSVTLRYTVFVW